VKQIKSALNKLERNLMAGDAGVYAQYGGGAVKLRRNKAK
jgi:hypothetical protein